MLKFLRKYRKAIPTGHPNFAAFSFVMDDIAEVRKSLLEGKNILSLKSLR